MHITQWGEYGILCCIYLAQREQLAGTTEQRTQVGASEIASAQGFSLDYAQQILQRLRRGGIVESARGPQGGYRLARPPQAITAFDILVATEGDSFQVICDTKPIDPTRCAPDTHCGLRLFWYQLKDHVNTFLQSQTLLDLLAEQTREGLLQSETPVQIGGRSK